MKKNIILAVLASFVFFACQKGSTPPSVDENPLQNRDDSSDHDLPTQLSKGINISNWFEDISNPSQYADLCTKEHFATIKKLGFTYVRIPIGRSILFQPENPSVLNPSNLPHVDHAIKIATDAGLGVVIDYHPGSKYNADEKQLFNTTSAMNSLVLYWKALATYFEKYSSSQVFFEVYDEQHAADLNGQPDQWQWWWPQQQKIIDAIREITQQHYIIVGAEGYNNISCLVANKPYSAHRIIYNFHFYQPFAFTHQGDLWASNSVYGLLHDVPYPSTPQNVSPLIAETSDTAVKNVLTTYGSIGYNFDRLDKIIKEAGDWAHSYRVPLICNEFGVYKKYAPSADRLQYLHDIKTIFEKYGIGWAIWDFNGRVDILEDENVVNTLRL